MKRKLKELNLEAELNLKIKDIMFLLKKFLSSNNDKRIQSIDLTERYAYGLSRDLVSKKKSLNRTI